MSSVISTLSVSASPALSLLSNVWSSRCRVSTFTGNAKGWFALTFGYDSIFSPGNFVWEDLLAAMYLICSVLMMCSPLLIRMSTPFHVAAVLITSERTITIQRSTVASYPFSVLGFFALKPAARKSSASNTLASVLYAKLPLSLLQIFPSFLFDEIASKLRHLKLPLSKQEPQTIHIGSRLWALLPWGFPLWSMNRSFRSHISKLSLISL